MVAVLGTLSILMISRIARRMTRSTMLGCIAGLLMSLDGLELVLSRTAILDIFVMFWVLAAFGMLVLDRDAMRARLADAAMAGEAAAGVAGVDLPGGGPTLGIRWRRVLAGVFLGFACASKWNGVWFLFSFAIMSIAWDLGARRAAGYRDRVTGVFRSDAKWLPLVFRRDPVRRVHRVLVGLVRRAALATTGTGPRWSAITRRSGRRSTRGTSTRSPCWASASA